MSGVPKIKKAVIPAAGKGKRLLPASAFLPKELMLVGQKPLIQYVIEEAIESGVCEIIIVINKEKEIIKKFILERIKISSLNLGRICKNVNFRFVYQEEPNGLMDAVYLTKNFLKNEPFALMLPDNIFFSKSPAIGRLILAFQNFNANIVGLLEVDKKNAPFFSNSGRISYIKQKNGIYRITNFYDKLRGYFRMSESRVMRTFARYIYTPTVFDYIEQQRKRYNQGELDDVPILRQMSREGLVYGCKLKGIGFDAGNYLGLHAANFYFFITKNKGLKWNFSSLAREQGSLP